MAPTAILIDDSLENSPYRFYHEFTKRNFEILRIFTPACIEARGLAAKLKTVTPAPIVYDGNFKELVERLRTMNIAAVVTGNEFSVTLCERLRVALELSPINDMQYLEAWRNKYVMIETLRAAGVPVAKQKLCKDMDEAAEYLKTAKFPLVLKPLMGALSRGVFICRDAAEGASGLISFFEEEMPQISEENQDNSLLIQEFLEGDEFIVDVATRDGQTKLLGIFKYHLRHSARGGIVKDHLMLMDSRGALADQLFDYAIKVVNALNFKVGASHLEIKMTPEGPKLVEVGMRLPVGAFPPPLITMSTDLEAMKVVVDSYVDPSSFAACPERYTKKLHALGVFLNPKYPGIVNLANTARVNELPSFRLLQLAKKDGVLLNATDSLDSVIGRVFLVHENKAQIEEDHLQLRRIEDTLIEKTSSN